MALTKRLPSHPTASERDNNKSKTTTSIARRPNRSHERSPLSVFFVCSALASQYTPIAAHIQVAIVYVSLIGAIIPHSI
jgi:hypothetical protein